MRLSLTWKERMASLLQVPIIYRLMFLAVRLIVPRHRIGVAVVLFDEDRNVLLLRHVFRPLAPWGLPGGWVSRNESPEEGVLRELSEETGLEVSLGPVIHMEHARLPSHLAIAYVADSARGRLQLSGEIVEASWVELGDLDHFNVLPFTRAAIVAGLHHMESRELPA